ncbi:MAG TPA: FAD-dependent oxidoreductase [Clostridiales bacterium]|nr:FAD-dependent oxidoreductase [Clostridiales bacterium]
MEYISFDPQNVKVVGEYDLIIVGGGTAGAIAAISASQEGVNTLVIEQFGALGGSGTNGLVTPVMPSGVCGNPEYCSISKKIFNKMESYGFAIEDIEESWHKDWFDPMMMKFVLEELCVEAGCNILYYTVLVDVIKEEEKIKYVIVKNKNGLSAYSAKCFIDCTGDGDLAYLSGVPMESGNHKGLNQAVSLRFQMTNIDLERFGLYLESIGQKKDTRYPFLHTAAVTGGKWPLYELFLEKFAEGYLGKTEITYFQAFSLPGKPRDLAFNCPELGQNKNVIDAWYMSRKQIEGKKSIMRLTAFLKKFVPGFEEAYLCDVAAMLGVRESRRIISDYYLKTEDLLSYKKFADGIAKSNYPVDIHGDEGAEGLVYKDISDNEKYYEIPFRSLVPVKIENLVVAGRCMGADFIAQSSTRVQHTCRATGEAAGIAAVLFIKEGTIFRNIDGSKIRNIMVSRGVDL